MTGYAAEQDYYQDLISITKEKLDLYCRYAVSLDENGALERIQGHLLFKRELEKLCEEPFSPEKIRMYDQEMAGIREREKIVRDKGNAFMESGNVLALEYLCRIFYLDELERHFLCMALAPELDRQFERVYCLLQDDYDLKFPTLDLCIQVLTLDPVRRLQLQQKAVERFETLAEIFEGVRRFSGSGEQALPGSLVSLPLKINGRLRLFLQDVMSMDESLKDFLQFYLPDQEVEPLYIRKESVHALHRLLEHTEGKRFLFLSGSRDSGRRLLVRWLARTEGKGLLMVQTSRLLGSGQAGELIRKILLESRLKGQAWICFTDVELSAEPELPSRELEELLWALRDYPGVPIFTSAMTWNGSADTMGRCCLEFPVELPSLRERTVLWKAFLSREEWPADLTAEMIAEKYVLPPGSIRRSVREARQQMLIAGERTLTSKQLFLSCQRQLVHKLGSDAVRIESPYAWEDLILPVPQKKLLQDACDQVGYQNQIYQEWGFQNKVAYGRGVSMIFYGPPGTGKTMGAQVMANQLNLELYKVNMASVMSRYVGESEKKLDYIFEQGKKSQSILFFDEADVLFGKRSETKDAQDKYANASTAYLLQKVEEYEGILILATNFLQNFDNAFCRRFKFIIEFPFPDRERREAIWDHVFPENLKCEEEIDTAWLAEEYNFSGSQIKNIVLSASFLAAGEGTGLSMRHILTAVKREQQKTGKHMIAADFGKYYYLMEQE